MRINHNISALNAWRQINQINYSMSKTLERLSSGLRINRAGDDAAGLAISEKMRGQIKGLNMAIKNAQDAISLIQTAEGALTEVHSILQRMRELAVQASGDTNTDVDRNQIQKELDQLREEIDRIARTTEFNTKKLLDGKLESFRATPDVKGVTGGNMNFQAAHASQVFTTQYSVKVGWYVPDISNLDDGTVHTFTLNYDQGSFQISLQSTGSNQITVKVYDSDGSELLKSVDVTTEPASFTVSYQGEEVTIYLDFTADMNTLLRAEVMAQRSGFRLPSDDEATDERYVMWYNGTFNVTDTISYTSATTVVLRANVGGTTYELGNYRVGIITTSSGNASIYVWDASGVTLKNVSVSAASVSNHAVITVDIGDYLLNVNFRDIDASTIDGSASNDAIVYVTTKPDVAIEGTYVAEVGQFVGNSDSPLDIRLVQSSASGVSTLFTGDFSRGVAFKNNIIFTWNGNAYTINDFGGAIPDERIVDSGVARVEAAYLDNTQLTFQIGANEGHNMVAGIDSMLAKDLGITEESLDVTTQDKAERTIMIVDAAIHKVSTARAALGAIQNRLEHTIANLGVAAENLTAAESRIRDADMAKEMMSFTKQQILLQSSMAMLAQANTLPQNVLQLMR